MMPIQFLIVVFALFAIARTGMQFRRGKVALLGVIGWSVFWIVVASVVLWPTTADALARIIGVGRGVDAVMYVSIIVLFYAVFRLLVRIEEVEREITRLVRTLALKDVEK